MDGLTVTKYVLENPENNLMQTMKKDIYRSHPDKKDTVGFIEGAHEIQKEYVFNRQY